jgi:glutathione S-transferase
MTLTICTYDWVPPGPRGFVRDIRLRWACGEAGLEYDVRSMPFDDRQGPAHRAQQPYGQVPFLQDGDLTIFESGACLLHLGEKSETLMPLEVQGRSEVTQWLISALNSIETVTVPWWFIGLSEPAENPLDGWMNGRLDHLEAVLAGRDWIAAGRFSIADILMVDALRIPRDHGALEERVALKDYVARGTARPAFVKARADQIAHFEAADATRETARS